MVCFSINTKLLNIKAMKISEATHTAMPPINPSMVFFGLISGQSLFFPKNLPQKYAPVSDIHATAKASNTKKLPYFPPKFLSSIIFPSDTEISIAMV